MTRRTSILVSLILLLGTDSPLWAQPGDASRSIPSERPNIVFALADDWGVHAGAYGTEGLDTPTFDRLAEKGVLFDRKVRALIEQLRAGGELENTIIVMTSDHGWPFPRGKSNLYDAGTRIPMAVYWPEVMANTEARTVSDFVNLLDLAPTFLEAAGISPPSQMTGRSLLDLLRAETDGRTDAHRSHTLLAKERHHGRARVDGTGYPMRAIRTTNYLYIRNYRPDRWPQGAPFLRSSQWIFSDTDDGPTKRWMIAHANEPDVRPLFRQTFAKRPAEELYDLRSDPHQLNNVADEAAYETVKEHLSTTLRQELRALNDPRQAGNGNRFDNSPYYTDYGSERVDPPASVKEALDLE